MPMRLLQPLNMTAAGNDPLEVQQEQARLTAQNQDTEEIKALLKLKLAEEDSHE